jgi:aspartate/methionine/tyrosine aminotransferase
MELPRLRRLAVDCGALDIAVGVPHKGPPKAVVAAAAEALAAGRHQYVDPAGLPQLRAAIAQDRLRRTGITVDPLTEVTVTCGAVEAVLVALLATTDPGDEVLIPEPYYESYPGIARIAGAVPVAVPLTVPDWRLDVDALRRAMTPRTRAIVLNTPHNPTGRVFTPTEMAAAVDLCAERGLVCVTDEVYDHYVFGQQPVVSGWSVPGGRARVIVTGGLSKTLRMTGWRIGYCIADPAMTEVLRRVHERTTIGAPTPMQYGAAALGVSDGDHDMPALTTARDLLARGLRDLGFEVRQPEGGWFVLAGTAALGLPSSELSVELIRRAGVLVAPGTAFFAEPRDGERWIRTTFVRDTATLTAALDRIATFLQAASSRETNR